MKIRIALAMVAATSLVANAGTDRLDAARKEFDLAIISHGYNCPVISKLARVAENARGIVFRVNCSSTDRRSNWSLRYIIKSDGGDIIEPW